MRPRSAQIERTTLETDIAVRLALDGQGNAAVETGIGFLDHLLTAFARHARMDLQLRCRGDLHIDDHHSAEDSALALGMALDQALGERKGIARFADALAPLDEALARAVVDCSGRPFAVVQLALGRGTIGGIACENVVHFIVSLAFASRTCIHVDVLRGENDHHRAEAAFKALGLAFRKAVRVEGPEAIPSTKGIL